MRVRVGDPARQRELVSYLESRGCTVRRIDEATLEVEPEVSRRDAAQLELDLYLRLWEAVSGTTADRLDSVD
jgi:hypothetical protein